MFMFLNKFNLFMSSGGPEEASGFSHCSLLLCGGGRGLPHLFSLSVDKSTIICYFIGVLRLRMLFLHHLHCFHTGQKKKQKNTNEC